MQLIMSGSILFLPPYTRGEKTFWSELELNPGPLASQATALTTRPWLLGRIDTKISSTRSHKGTLNIALFPHSPSHTLSSNFRHSINCLGLRTHPPSLSYTNASMQARTRTRTPTTTHTSTLISRISPTHFDTQVSCTV